jgi:hypothetical protein
MSENKPFSVGDIRTYVSKKKTLEIVKIVKIQGEQIFVQRLNVDLDTWETPIIKLTTKSKWGTYITTVDKRCWFMRLVLRIKGYFGYGA